MEEVLDDKKLFILDASGFIFRSYFALPLMTSPRGDAIQVVFGFIRSFNKMQKEFHLAHVVAVFDGPNNKKSRKSIYSEYKSNRHEKFDDLPNQIFLIKEFCNLIGLPYVEVDGVEADDVIGSIAVFAESRGFKVFICSSDKDLCQLVNENIYILNPWKNNLVLKRKDVKDLYGVFPENIADYLALVGDPVDNIPGVKGCGPKGAIKLLESFGSIENLLLALNNGQLEKNKQLRNVETSQDILKISKKLSIIDTSVSFPITSNMFQLEIPNSQDFLYNFYRELGFTSLIKKEKNEINCKEKTKTYRKILSTDELEEVIKLLEVSDTVSFIIHYEGASTHSLNVLGLCLYTEESKSIYIPKEVFQDDFNFKDFIESVLCLKKLIGFSAKNDLHALRSISDKDFFIYFDTAIAGYLLHTGDREFSLQKLSKIYLPNSNFEKIFHLKDYKREVLITKEEYGYEVFCEIVELSFLLYPILEKALEQRELTQLFRFIEMPLIYSLFSMERNGVFINVSELQELGENLKQELNFLEKKIHDMAGQIFNINSSKQLAHILFNVLKLPFSEEKFSTRAEILESLIDKHPIISEILSYRMMEKLRSTYVMALPKQINLQTQRLHPTFIQTLTATGRLACQNPNLQNIPIKTDLGLKIRHAFCPQSSDRNFISFDYSQIELRFLAHFSSDLKMTEAFLLGQDIHSVTASEIFQVPLCEVTKEQRRQAKAMNFGLIYGQQAYGLSKILKISLQKSKELIESYFSRYPSIKDYLEDIVEKASKEGIVTTLLGRERKINGLHSRNALERNSARRLAVNTPMQGSAADLIKLSMVKIRELFLREKIRSYLILQVHDELIFEVFSEEEEFLIKEIKKIMETVVILRVPLITNISIGKNWTEC